MTFLEFVQDQGWKLLLPFQTRFKFTHARYNSRKEFYTIMVIDFLLIAFFIVALA